ncbi:MAG: hypothetical protein Q4G09_07575 [Clostridia bacterium]|nr:hypothetical protein [Clostridia bacterium]
MKVCYIREGKDTSDVIKKVLIIIKRFFNIIEIDKNKEKLMYYLPIFKTTKVSENKIKKFSEKIIQKLEKEGIQDIVLSKHLETINDLKLKLYSENINILDGRLLFKCLIYEALEYISKIKNKKIQELDITFTINEFNNINKDIIILIAKNVKTLNIITNHIQKLKRVQQYLHEEFGVMLNVLNNKKKSLLNSEIIINFDFPQELLNQYKIYDKAIILNILGKTPIHIKKFNGININYFKITMPKKYELREFNNEIIYESIIYENAKFANIRKRIIQDKIKIQKLIGNNGEIRENEIA